MIFNQSRFVALKEALTELGVTGMTITQVMGCGTQKGHTNYYRGIKVEEAALLPKIKLEVVVSKVPVEDVISLAKKYFILVTSAMERSLSMMQKMW